MAGRQLPCTDHRGTGAGVRGRLRADRLRHGRSHVGAGGGSARLGLLAGVRAADHAHRAAAAEPRRHSVRWRGLRRSRAGNQQRFPERPGQGRGHRRHLRLAGGAELRPPHRDLQAAGLAVQPAALLGRAVPHRVRRDGPSPGGARGRIAGRAARADRLGASSAR